MKFEPIATSRLTESVRVYAGLRDAILDLSMPPGHTLDERDVCARFGVSRSPVREALLRLTTEGLIRLEGGESIVGDVSPKDLETFMALHFYLAGMVARLAATARSSRDVTRLGIANAELTTTDMEWTKAMAGLRVFRLTLATASGNSIFSTWTLQLLDQEERLSRALLGSASHHPTIATSSIRRAIVDAISRSDPNAAEHAAGQESNALAIAFGSK